ncbi:DUF418 domain-containing protein [Pseudonocardia spinosispora]|uniref:DUF418 domain-containing protein n=1 Tax=Pseudonocardia spinosispora TaxID=103441 RepID=UPI0005602B6B|nr:DUF418 domain-containing protein [Pseudonocardia spinosispora]
MADRIESLDLLRGVAIIGTLGTNIWIFTDPGGIVGFFADVPRTGSVGDTVELLLRSLANGKFLGLLTVLFGVGLELQYRSARRRGARWPGWYLWRSALLLIEGALHFVLVFEGDVLMAYAITSFVVAYLVGRSDRAVRAVMIVLGVTQVAVLSLGTAVLLSGSPGQGVQIPGVDPRLYSEGGYFAQVLMRMDNALLLRAEAVIIVPSAVVLFLAGSRLLRAGVFADSDRGQLIRTRLIIAGLLVAAPLNLATGLAGPGWVLLDRYLLPPIVALGLLGLVTTIALRHREAPGRCRRALAAVGRCALSCYVFQNLVASALCYGWGLGLADTLSGYRPWWVIGLWAGISLSFAVLATVWVGRHERGPLEIVWQWAYQRPMAVSRKDTRNARVG